MNMMVIKTKTGNREIGAGKPTFIVAELSGNHNHDISRAFGIIDAVQKAGADAIKLQTYTPDTLTINSDNKWFKIKGGNAWSGQTLYELYKRAYTPWEWQPKLKAYAEKKGLVCFSTPFDETAVDFLEKMNVPLYKIASFELNDIELLKRVGRTKKPVIASRGLASAEEIARAIKTLKTAGAPSVAILHCVSSYPAKPEEMNLATVRDIQSKFKVVAGLSDHSLSPYVPITAVALGASVIEKHVTLRRADGGTDSEFSLEPQELAELVKAIRETEASVGKATYAASKSEKKNLVFRRSLFVVKDVAKGEKVSRENVRSIRPGYGLEPRMLSKVLKKKFVKSVKRGTPLQSPLIS